MCDSWLFPPSAGTLRRTPSLKVQHLEATSSFPPSSFTQAVEERDHRTDSAGGTADHHHCLAHHLHLHRREAPSTGSLRVTSPPGGQTASPWIFHHRVLIQLTTKKRKHTIERVHSSAASQHLDLSTFTLNGPASWTVRPCQQLPGHMVIILS